MTLRRCWILLAAAAWILYVWGTRLFLLWGGDETFAFKAVHTVLAAVSIAFALAIGWIGFDARRQIRRRSGDALAVPGAPGPFETSRAG